jgi:hypothetical protein
MDSRTGRWLRIKESEARDKVGHAIRKAIQRLEETRPKTIARLKNQYAASSALAQPTAQPAAAQPAAQPAQSSTSRSQEGGAASSKTSYQIKGGETSQSDRSSTQQPKLLRAPGGVPILASRHGDSSEERGNHSRPGPSSSALVAGLGNAALQQRLLPPHHHLHLLNRSSAQLALPGGGGDLLSGTNLSSRNLPLSASQLVTQRLWAQQNHHALPGVPSPYEQSIFGHSLHPRSSGQQHSSLGRSMGGSSESAKQARQDSLIIKVLQQREQESRRLKELEYARRLVLMEGGLVLPGLTGGTQLTGGQHHHQQGRTANIPGRMTSLNATLQHQSASRAKQETSQTHSEYSLLVGLLASSQNNGDARKQDTPPQRRRG